MTMIDKVADALQQRFKSGNDKWRDLAKAAIEAMRDIDIKLMYILRDDGYDAMIDAALKED